MTSFPAWCNPFLLIEQLLEKAEKLWKNPKSLLSGFGVHYKMLCVGDLPL